MNTTQALKNLIKAHDEYADARCALIYVGIPYDDEQFRDGSRLQLATSALYKAVADAKEALA